MSGIISRGECLRRFEQVVRHVNERSYAEAMGGCLWLWDHARDIDKSLVAVRLSLLPQQMKILADKYEAMRGVIASMRDAIAVDSASHECVVDWILLNRILGQRHRTLAWYDSLAASRALEVIGQFKLQIFEEFVYADRWSEAGLVYENPVDDFRSATDGVLKNGWTAGVQEFEYLLYRGYVVVKALRSAERGEEALQVAALASAALATFSTR